MVDLSVFKGDSQDYNFTIKDGDGAAINITGYTFYLTVRESNAAGDAKIAKIVTSHTAPTAGQTTISISSSDTSIDVSSSTQQYVYDVRMKDTTAKVTTLLNGNFKVRQPITLSTA